MMMQEETKATFPWIKTDISQEEIERGLAQTVAGLEAAGQLRIYDIDTESIVAVYEGMDIYKALIVGQHIIEAAHNMIDVQPVVDQETLRVAKAVFDKVFKDSHK